MLGGRSRSGRPYFDLAYPVGAAAAGVLLGGRLRSAIMVAKGDWKVGKSRLATIGQPMVGGKRYLMAGFGGDAFHTGFLAQSDQAVVELPADFDVRPLAGKTAVEQAQAIFDARGAQVERLLQQLHREKQMLDQTVPKPRTRK